LRGWLDTGWMLIALFAVLGVDLVVIMVLVGVLARRRWVSDEPGAFGEAIRITGGGVPGLGTRWMRGYGRWVREILVWARAPFCSGMSWWWQMLRRALLARSSRVRWGVLKACRDCGAGRRRWRADRGCCFGRWA
jgi:cyanate permease